MTGEYQLEVELGAKTRSNHGKDSFTALLLSYKRPTAIPGLLQMLSGIPELHAVHNFQIGHKQVPFSAVV